LAENDKSITIPCSMDYKRNVKAAIMDRGIDSFQIGYQKIFDLGLSQFKRKEIKKS